MNGYRRGIQVGARVQYREEERIPGKGTVLMLYVARFGGTHAIVQWDRGYQDKVPSSRLTLVIDQKTPGCSPVETG